MLIDTGPMIALADKGQSRHLECAALVEQLPGILVTTWACLTEALYFLHGLRGWRGQDALWRYVEAQEILLHNPQADEAMRVYQLMRQYRDTPMDFADASLVSLAELSGAHQILTLDDDFFFYRINGQDLFEVLPTRTPKRTR